MVRKEPLERWSVEKSAELYNIRSWSAGYFDINERGEVVYQYKTKQGILQVSLMDIIRGIRARGLSFPVLLRISNILDSQITLLHESFRKAIQAFNYKGKYQGVFPIKVNQQQQVLEEVSEFGSRYHHGFEAGSKAELLAALAFLKDPEAIIVCNGYKDSEFIDLGLYATKLGYRCIFVIEMPSEADLILERSRFLGVEPWIGVRIKLSSKASGHWTESGGDRSIFGLSLPEVVELVDKLKKENALGWLRLLHYHVGSQIPNIRDIRSAVQEATRVYVGLVSEGAPMGFVDFGGGLAVDYDGSQTNYHSSRNYTVEDYCTDIVETVMSIVDENQIDHPTIVTESGRFLVAYYSVLVFNILDVTRFTPAPPPATLPEGTHELTQNLFETYQKLSIKNLQESINDAIYYRDQIRDIFKHGDISLRERALAENIFWNIVSIVSEKSRGMKKIPVEIEGIEVALSDIYYGNFSVFQSLPDTWAIDQVFPVMPLHRLDTMPNRDAIISDITCDSDGKLDHFIDPHGEKLTLPLHELKGDEEYYVGVFLVGAYQETLGDLHNLLGDTNVVTIRINEDGTYNFVSEIEGDSVADVLSYVEYDIKYIRRRFREMAEKAVSENRISVQERASILKALEDGLDGYTYYEKD
ncbi:MAG: biosynthetic arginine decarboxylase [Brevinematales bacterium]